MGLVHAAPWSAHACALLRPHATRSPPCSLRLAPQQGGIYHGRILLPPDYPFKPPAFMMLTPSGRFETGVKICLSISSHHPEHWQPSWSVRTALTALIAFMPSPGNGALGSLVRAPSTPRWALHSASLSLIREATGNKPGEKRRARASQGCLVAALRPPPFHSRPLLITGLPEGGEGQDGG